jgi:hypothetical protein
MIKQAVRMFEELCELAHLASARFDAAPVSYGNHVQLYAEEIRCATAVNLQDETNTFESSSGEALGNVPQVSRSRVPHLQAHVYVQAFTHGSFSLLLPVPF